MEELYQNNGFMISIAILVIVSALGIVVRFLPFSADQKKKKEILILTTEVVATSTIYFSLLHFNKGKSAFLIIFLTCIYPAILFLKIRSTINTLVG